MAEYAKAVERLLSLPLSDRNTYGQNRIYSVDALLTLIELIAACTAKFQPGGRASSCVVSQQLITRLLEESSVQCDNNAEKDYLFDRKWYITPFTFRVVRPEMESDILWSLIISEKGTDKRFKHRFYSTYGTAKESELLARAKWYAYRLSIFLVSLQSDAIEVKEEEVQFEIIPCFRQDNNKHSITWIIEFLRYDLEDRCPVKPWMLAGSSELLHPPISFKTEWIRDQKLVWTHYINEFFVYRYGSDILSQVTGTTD